MFLSESYFGIKIRVRQEELIPQCLCERQNKVHFVVLFCDLSLFFEYWVCFVKRTDNNFPVFLPSTKFHFSFELLMNEQGAEWIGQCRMCPYLGGRTGAEWFSPLSIIKDLRFYRPNTRAQITFNPTGAPRVKVFQPTRGGSPRLHVVFNSLNPP